MTDFEEALLMLFEELIKVNERQAEALEKIADAFNFDE
tara:strand:+ start:240 stop:353 length:114 start_codon:yes stop_codon:yes gene_type:complete